MLGAGSKRLRRILGAALLATGFVLLVRAAWVAYPLTKPDFASPPAGAVGPFDTAIRSAALGILAAAIGGLLSRSAASERGG